MRTPMIALWFGLALMLATIIALVSDMPLWGALLIAAFAMLVNSWILKVEDDQPGRFNNPNEDGAPTNRIVRMCFRIAGTLLGLTCLGMGILFFGDPPSPETWWRSYLVPIGFIITGVYFAHYGLTGRSKLFRRR